MDTPRSNNFPNKTAKFFYNLCLISYYCGQPNFWITELAISKRTALLFRVYSRIMTGCIYCFLISEYAAIFTQNNLTVAQEENFMVYLMSHPMLWSYSVIFCAKIDKVRKILADILDLKQVFNDPEVEKKMMKKSLLYSMAFVSLCGVSMLMYTFDAIALLIKKEGTFTTVITAWPKVDDTSTAANICRVWCNILWWAMMSRVMNVYAFVFSLTSCMSHQFVDLQNYFNSLNDIFIDNHLSQSQKELDYEVAYKIGIKLHSDTLKCVEQSKNICGWQFSGQIIFNTIMLVLMVSQLLEADLVHAGAIGIAAFSILMATGLFMCSAGDVTVEASKLCTAMYSSGWQNCYGHSAVRVRKLIMTSMVFAQRPVLIKGFGIMDLSYQSYVSVVKSTYSVFSLIFQQAQ